MNKHASELARLKWSKKTPEERKDHSDMMNEEKRKKKLSTVSNLHLTQGNASIMTQGNT